MIDEAFGYSSEPRGVYRVLVHNTIEAHAWIEVEASSMDDAVHDALIAARKKPMHEWLFEDDDMIVEEVEPPELARTQTTSAIPAQIGSLSATDEGL